MELIEDGLRQDDLPLGCVFPAKADFQLGTPHTKGANRPSHSVCDFRITEALLDQGGDQCWICLALSHVAPLSSVVAGASCPGPSLIPVSLLEKMARAIYRKLYRLVSRLAGTKRVSFESVFTVPPPTYPLGSDARISRHPKKADLFQSTLCHIDGGVGTPENYDLGCADRLLKKHGERGRAGKDVKRGD